MIYTLKCKVKCCCSNLFIFCLFLVMLSKMSPSLIKIKWKSCTSHQKCRYSLIACLICSYVFYTLFYPSAIIISACGGNFSNAQSQIFSSEDIRGFYNNILQERTTRYRIQSCSDHWGKNTQLYCSLVTSSLFGYNWLFFYLSSPTISWGYPDTVVNISLIPVPLKVQLSHYNKPTIVKRNLEKQGRVVPCSEVICRLYAVTLNTMHIRINFP